jgi:dienelactone hydrolase
VAEVVLIHAVLGLRAGVRAAAERLGRDGHRVVTPDLYDGEVFNSLEDGRRKRDGLGIAELERRARSADARIPGPVVYAGFSMGAAIAEMLAVNSANALGVVLVHGALPAQAFGKDSWPRSLPTQVHYAAADPLVDEGAVGELRSQVEMSGSIFERYTYPGSGHLFAEPGLPDYDAALAELMLTRVSSFLSRCG